MNAATLKALRGSIRKWKSIEEGKGVDRGRHNCPLCALYYERGPGHCHGCPVSESTGACFCIGTPYEEWSDVTEPCDSAGTRAVTARECNIARKFRLWLEALLPKKGK